MHVSTIYLSEDSDGLGVGTQPHGRTAGNLHQVVGPRQHRRELVACVVGGEGDCDVEAVGRLQFVPQSVVSEDTIWLQWML